MATKVLKAFLVLDIVLLNIGLTYFFVDKFLLTPKPEANLQEQQTVLQEPQSQGCGNDCLAYIDSEIARKFSSASSTLMVSPAPTVQAQKSKTKSTNYLPISGNGNTNQTDWTTVSASDFYLSKADYPGLTEVYFEANVRLVNGNGYAYVRLYDATHNIGVNGSELSTSSQTSVFLSSKNLNLWDGYNHYVIQAKSLTADTTVFDSGRLKIISYN